jgi:hypothetical protein
MYRPALLGVATLHYALAKAAVDTWQKSIWLAPLDAGVASPWESAREIGGVAPVLADAPAPGARFAELPADAARVESFERWRKALASHLLRARPLRLWRTAQPALQSLPGESEGAFRVRVRDATRAERDAAVEKLREKYAAQDARLREQEARAAHREAAEQEQYDARRIESALSLGKTVLGALFGRKIASRANLDRATTAARSIGRAADERGDIARAADRVEQVRARRAELEARCAAEIAEIDARYRASAEAALDELRVAPRKGDLEVEPPILLWTPWRVGADGTATPAWTER